MVQIIPAAEPKRTFLQSLGLGIGQGLERGLGSLGDLYIERQKEKRLSEALGDIQGVYGNENLSEQQKLLEAYKRLGGFPNVAQQLGNQLSRLGLQQNKDLLNQNKQQQLNDAVADIQNVYNDPNLSDEEKTFYAFQKLNQNPTLAKHLTDAMQKPNKIKNEAVANRQFSLGYDAITNNDRDALRDVLDDPNTPLSVKTKLSDLWEKRSIRKDVSARELRARQNLVARSYQQAINTEQSRLKGYLSPSERKEVKEKISRLQKSMKQDLRQLTKNPEDYMNLSIWNDPEFLPEKENEYEDTFEAEEPLPKETKAKVRFDPKNIDHVTRAKRVLEQAGGDRAKANMILAEEFSE